jgi:3-oxoacid CoA-transferase B subunit
MDLAVGARKVIVAMEHCDRSGDSKIVSECTFPLTARRCVSLIVTDVAVFEVQTSERGLRLIEVAPGWDAEAVGAITAADFTVSGELKEFELL